MDAVQGVTCIQVPSGRMQGHQTDQIRLTRALWGLLSGNGTAFGEAALVDAARTGEEEGDERELGVAERRGRRTSNRTRRRPWAATPSRSLLGTARRTRKTIAAEGLGSPRESQRTAPVSAPARAQESPRRARTLQVWQAGGRAWCAAACYLSLSLLLWFTRAGLGISILSAQSSTT